MSFPSYVLAIIYFPLLISCISGIKNVNNVQQFIATDKIQAEFYTSATYANIYDDCTQDLTITYLGDLSTATILQYDQVDFGNGMQRVSLRVANIEPNEAVNIALHLSSASATPFLTVPINPTGSDKSAFVTVDVALQTIPAGKQNLYITISSGKGGQLFLDWFRFIQTSRGVIPATERIQAEDFVDMTEMKVSNSCSDITIVATGCCSLAEYDRVDFGVGVQSVRVRGYYTSTNAQSIAFKTGSSSNTAFAVLQFSNMSENCMFSEFSVDVTVEPTGVQNLFLMTGYAYNIFIDSFVFVREAGKWNATEKIEAEDYTSATNVSLFADCSDTNIFYVGSLLPNSLLEYDGVDFGSGVGIVTLRVSSIYTGAPLDVALHVGTSTSTPFVTVPVGQTGTERCDFFTTTTFLDTRPTGVQKLFFTFPSAQGGYLHLDWFQFNQTV